MKERPIIFVTENVKAILDGRKTQTRRVTKPQLISGQIIKHYQGGLWSVCPEYDQIQCLYGINCPYGQVGDRLWLKEKHKLTAYPTRFSPEYIKCEYLD